MARSTSVRPASFSPSKKVQDQQQPRGTLGSHIDCVALIVSIATERGVDPYEWFLDSEGDENVGENGCLQQAEFINRLSSLAFAVAINESSKTMLEIERGLSDTAIRAVADECGVNDNEINVQAFLELCSVRIEGGHVYRAGGAVSPLSSPKLGKGASYFFADKLTSSPYDAEFLFDIDGEVSGGNGGVSSASPQRKSSKVSSITPPPTRKLLSSRIGSNGHSSVGVDAASGSGSKPRTKPSLHVSIDQPATMPAQVPSSVPGPSFIKIQTSARSRPRTPAAASISASTGPLYGQQQLLLQTASDVVEDTLRNIVRKPNLYFQVQAHLGWQTPHTTVSRVALPTPSSWKDDQWLELETLRAAFLDGAKVRLTEAQMDVMVQLVSTFAHDPRGQARMEHGTSVDAAARDMQALTASGTHTSLHSATAVGPVAAKKRRQRLRRAWKVLHRGRLSAQWLHEYLEHLRLHNRCSSALTETLSVGGSSSVPVQRRQPEANTQASVTTSSPLSISVSVSVSAGRASPSSESRFGGGGGGGCLESGPTLSTTLPSATASVSASAIASAAATASAAVHAELRRALSGRPHGLTGRAELKALLRLHPLLSEAELAAEVRHRVSCWRADLCGTGGFSRALRLAAVHWARQFAPGVGWAKLPEFTRTDAALELEAQVLRVRQEELLTAERLSLDISLDLFYKYDSFCRDSNYSEACSWREWISWWQGDKALKDAAVDVQLLQRGASERLMTSLDRAARRADSYNQRSQFAFVVPVDEAPPSPAKVARQVRLASRKLQQEQAKAKAQGQAKGNSSGRRAASMPRAASRPGSAPAGKFTTAPSSSSSSSYGRSRSQSRSNASGPTRSSSTSPRSRSQSQDEETPRRPSLGQTHGAELRDTLAAARSGLMAAGLGKDQVLGGSLHDVLYALDVPLPPDSPRPATRKYSGSGGSGVASSVLGSKDTSKDGIKEDGSKSKLSVQSEIRSSATSLRRWAAKKASAQRAARVEEECIASEQAAQKEAKASEAQRQFKVWCRLRAQGKYKSGDGQAEVKLLPIGNAVSHRASWDKFVTRKNVPRASASKEVVVASTSTSTISSSNKVEADRRSSRPLTLTSILSHGSISASEGSGSKPKRRVSFDDDGGELAEASMSLLSL